MAVQTPGDQPNSTMSEALARANLGAEPRTAEASAGPVPPNPPSSGGGPKVKISEINTRIYSPFSRAPAGETARQFATLIKESIAANLKESDVPQYGVDILDNNEAPIPYTTLTVSYAVNVNGVNHASIYILVVEASSDGIENRVFNKGPGQTFEVESWAGDVVDQDLRERVARQLALRLGEKITIHFAGASILPKELKPETAQDVRDIARTAVNALFVTMDREVVHTQPRLSIPDLDTSANVAVVLDYSPRPVFTSTGLPIRSNLSVTMRSGGSNSRDRIQQLTRVDGYVDLIWRAPEPQVPNAYGQLPPPPRYFNQLFVATRMDSQANATTPEFQLLALSTLPVLSMNKSTLGVFSPLFQGETNPREQNLRNLGALGYEINLSQDPNAKPEAFPIKRDGFNNNSLIELAQRLFYDEIIFARDIEEVGDTSWLEIHLLEAAMGNSDAYQYITKTADALTGGIFGRLWDNTRPIASYTGIRQQLGYFTSKKGVRSDIREIDYLALRNLFKDQDNGLVERFDQTYYNTSISEAERTSVRADIYRSVVPDFELKGYARRLFLNAQFLQTLALACEKAGLHPRANNLFAIDGNGGRVPFSQLDFGMLPNTGTQFYGATGASAAQNFESPMPFASLFRQ